MYFMLLSSTTAYSDPLLIASFAYRFPLNDSPFKAKNIEPSGQLRLSVVTDVQERYIS